MTFAGEAAETLPPLEVQNHFGIDVRDFLGGRGNRHWRVTRGAETLVLRRWAEAGASVDWEVRLMAHLAQRGWPVPRVLDGPLAIEGRLWSLSPFLPGEPSPTHHGPEAEQRARGRRLAEFHADVAAGAELADLGQRPGWRRCEEILADPTLDQTLADYERSAPDEAHLLRRHLDRARERIAPLAAETRPGLVVHGDWTPWNLRFDADDDGRLTALLDFELAHRDHRIADFALAWRGKYDAVIQGYDEITPLAPWEWELLTPLWWATLIEGACRDLRAGRRDDGWTIGKLLLRSPLMGEGGFP